MSRNCLIGWVTLWLTTTIPSPQSLEYCFSYHKYPWLCLFKISFPAAGTSSVSAEGVRDPPFPGWGVPHPGAIPTCHQLQEWVPGKTTWFPLACYGSHPSSCTGQVAQTAAGVFGLLPAQGRALSWAVPPGQPSLSRPAHHVPQHIRTFSCPFPFPCLSLSPAALCHHSTTLVRVLSAAALPHHSVPATHGANQGTGAKLQPGCVCGEAHPPQPPSLTSSALTDFQDYSWCRPGMLLDFWQLFSRGSCFTPGSNDRICVQYQENVNFL